MTRRLVGRWGTESVLLSFRHMASPYALAFGRPLVGTKQGLCPELGFTVSAVPSIFTISTWNHTLPRIQGLSTGHLGSHTLILVHTLTMNFHRGKQSCKLLCAFIWGECFCLWRIMPGGRWQPLSDDRGTSVPVGVSAQLFRGEQTCAAAVGGIRLLSGSPWVKCWGTWGYRWALIQQHSSVAGRAGASPRPRGMSPSTVTWASQVEGQGAGSGVAAHPTKSWDTHYRRKGPDIERKRLPVTAWVLVKTFLVGAGTREWMLLNCGVGEDSWESLGLQGDPTSPS